MRIKSKILVSFLIIYLVLLVLMIVGSVLIGQEANQEQSMILLAGMSFVVITMVILILSYLLNKSISEPIVSLTEDIQDISEGDLSKELEVKSSDEIGELTESLMRIIKSMKLAILRTGVSKEEIGLGEALAAKEKAERDLEESESRFRGFFENAFHGMVVVNKEGQLELLNRKAATMLGYPQKELLGKSDIGLTHPDDLENSKKEFKKLLNGEVKSYRIEKRYLKKDGSYVWVDLSVKPIFDANGEIEGVVNIIVDISEGKEAEEKLKNSEERLKLLFEFAPDGYYIHDMKGTLLNVNIAAEKMVGYKKADVIGKNMLKLDLLPKNEIPRAVKSFAMSAMGKPTGPDEYTLIHKNGKQLVVEIRTHPIKLNGENVVLAIMRDITKRKHTEGELYKEEKRAQKYFNMAGVMLVGIDANQKVTEINVKGCQILGYSKEEIVGKNWFTNFIPSKIRKEVRKVFSEIMAGKIKPLEYFENPVLTKDGNERIISWYNSVQRDDDGNIMGTISSGEDITEKKRLEEELRKIKKKLKREYK